MDGIATAAEAAGEAKAIAEDVKEDVEELEEQIEETEAAVSLDREIDDSWHQTITTRLEAIEQAIAELRQPTPEPAPELDEEAGRGETSGEAAEISIVEPAPAEQAKPRRKDRYTREIRFH